MKTKMMKTLLLSTAVIMALSACADKDKNKKPDDKTTVTVNGNGSATDIVEAGEQLVGPYTFPLADRAFALALEKDPSNLKAQFYRAVLKPLMRARGILDRSRPYARQYGNIAALEDTIKKMPDHPLRNFLIDSKGLKPIADAQDIQDFLGEQREDWNDLRIFLAKNQRLEFDIYLNPSVFAEKINENIQNSCVVTQKPENGFEVVCDTKDVAKVKVNVADLLALRQIAAGQVLFYSLYTSYSVKGLDTLFKDLQAASVEVCEPYSGYWDNAQQRWVTTGGGCTRPNRQLSQREVRDRLMNTQTAGKLLKNQGLKHLQGIGTDLSVAMKWAIQYQREICPQGVSKPGSRKGHLFENGLCIEDATEAQKQVGLFDQYIAGVVKNAAIETSHGEEITDIDVLALARKPVQDLRLLAPEVDANDCAVSLKDKTFGGMYPRGDAEKFILERCK